LVKKKKIKVDRGENKEEVVVTDKYLYMRNKGGGKILNEMLKARGEDEIEIVVL